MRFALQEENDEWLSEKRAFKLKHKTIDNRLAMRLYFIMTAVLLKCFVMVMFLVFTVIKNKNEKKKSIIRSKIGDTIDD